VSRSVLRNAKRNILLHILLKLLNLWLQKHVRNPPLYSYTVIPFYFMAKKHGVTTLFSISPVYQPPRSILWAIKHHNLCTGLETVMFRPCHWQCTKGVKNWGRNGWILTPNELDLTIWVPDYSANFHQNWVRIVTVGGWTDRQTDRQTDYLSHAMLCYTGAQ